jgi:hypothetical protein
VTSVISAAGNLPAPLTSFVGRRREIAEIRRLLGTGRLVTLTGVGGVGKTRLALGVAEASRKAFPDGAWLVDLGAVRDPSAVAFAVAGALRVPDLGGPVLDHLTGRLARHRALIVLDNCEHLIDSAAQLAKALLSACPELCILATSRRTLGITGEHVFTVPPLSVPDEALELLRDRATAIRPDFRISSADLALAVRLCADLDGLPLAAHADRRAARGPTGGPVRAADRRLPDHTSAPAHAARDDRVEPRAVHARRAAAVASAVGIRGRIHPGRRRGRLYG